MAMKWLASSSQSTSIGNITGLNGATNASWAFWFQYPVTPTATNQNFGRQSGNPGFWSRATGGSPASLDIVFNTGITATFPASILTIGTWYYIAMAYDGSQSTNATKFAAWVDGASQTLTFAGTVPTSLANPGAINWTFGQAGGSFNPVQFAHFKLWLATLTLGEFEAERWVYHPARTANLEAWLPFSETSSPDYSQHGHTATDTNTPTIVPDPPASYGGPQTYGTS
jgi:hypothetical protein